MLRFMLPAHPLRVVLNDEVHARPSSALSPPLRVSYLALLADGTDRRGDWQQVCALAQRYGADCPSEHARHYIADLGAFQLTWEQHTEFTRFQFLAPLDDRDSFSAPALGLVPDDWLATLGGHVIFAAHAAMLSVDDSGADHEPFAERYFEGNMLVGARVAGGSATALTDFRVHADGYNRLLILDHSMTPRQRGRTLQRLLEIDTYRVMALLALPVARELAPFLTSSEHELAGITDALAGAGAADEPSLLERLTRLEAEMEHRESEHDYRFGAAVAYYDLVRQRIEDLREVRIEGLQTFREFTERRLSPAMSTCRTVARRQQSLSERVARVTQLLSTRIDITRESQNQAVLESMNRRAAAQLRLQQTVEGLSIAAITYYIVGLVGYAAKGVEAAGAAVDPDIAMAVSIPIVIALVALGIRRVRRALSVEAV